MNRIISVFLFFSQFLFSQKLKQEVFFSENGNYALLNELDTLDTCKCPFKNNLFLYNSKNNEEFTIIKFKDSVYFEDGTGLKEEVKLDSIACVKNSVKYKVRDTTSIVSFKIFNKMTEKELYENYNLNKKGVLVNSEIKYKIENIRDTIYRQLNMYEEFYDMNAKVFDVKFIHKNKVVKKISQNFYLILDSDNYEIINYSKLKKQFDKDFKNYIKQLEKEIKLSVKDKNENNKYVNFKFYNYLNYYYIDFVLEDKLICDIELTDDCFNNVNSQMMDIDAYYRAYPEFNPVDEFIILD